jgi:hypothetical protein
MSLRLLIAATTGVVLASVAAPGGVSSNGAQSNPGESGPFARIAFLQPNNGDTIDFEAGYLRHLAFHRQAGDSWRWYGWTIWAGDRQRWLIYATFGHSATSLDNPVSPAEDERDNIANVVPHARFAGNAIYEYLPALSSGNGVPTPLPRAELTTVDIHRGARESFEAAIAARRPTSGEVLWYRIAAGGPSGRYVRLRPRPTLAALLSETGERALPDDPAIVAAATVEILNFRPTLSYGIAPDSR